MFEDPLLNQIVARGIFVTVVLLGSWVIYRWDEARKEQATDRINSLEAMLERKDRQHARSEETLRAQYDDYLAARDRRIDELVQQNQNLAERIASLRQNTSLTDGGNDFHVETPEPVEPYSEELQRFYEGIASREAQQQVERFIEQRRAHGIADEQIVRELDREGSIA